MAGPSTRARPSARSAAQGTAPKDSTLRKDRAPEIPWAKRPELTERLLSYLRDNPTFRIQLFSESLQEAKAAGRKVKTGKESRAQLHTKLAKHIFEQDDMEAAGFASDTKRYANSVQHRMKKLRKDYQEHVQELSATGAGLEREDITPGSVIANQIDKIVAVFPHWHELHSYWKELPNYNPVGISSSAPGEDHATAAETLFSSENVPDHQSDSETEKTEWQSGKSAKSEGRSDGDDLAAEAFELNDDPLAADDDVLSAGAPPAQSRRRSMPDTPREPSPQPAKKPKQVHANTDAGSRASTPGSMSSHSTVGARKAGPPGKRAPLDILKDARFADMDRLARKAELVAAENMARIAADKDVRLAKYKAREKETEARARERELDRQVAAEEREHQRQMLRMRIEAGQAMSSNGLDLGSLPPFPSDGFNSFPGF